MNKKTNDNSILSGIKSPSRVKELTDEELICLCSEIRKVLVDTVATNGGHLASNLGTVELTVAIHKTFSSPNDRIIWDVGHQAYTHKLLTGRYEKFSGLRSENGISGFVRPDESEHDSFYEGHAGTSVSQAAGVAAANAIKGSKNYAVAVIGDGSFGNGLVYEALNHAGSTKNRLIIILNDNEMSISENVGSMARYLAVVRAKPEYYRFKAGTEKALNRIPIIGRSLSNHLFRLKTALKNMIYSSSFFEDLGFKYIGPIDGHNINNLCEAMDSAKMINGPTVIHINTVKGKGYEFAENSPSEYHGVSRLDVDTGKPLSGGMNYSEVFGDTLCEFAQKDKRICAITAAMALGTGLEKFSREFPDRFFDVGIAESYAVTFASGLSAQGLIPVFAVYSTFMQRCVDQLIHDGALQRRKMIVCVDRAGFIGEDGETHQGVFDVALLQSFPNTTVYSPSTYKELKKALYNSLYKDENLVVIRYPRGAMPDGFDAECSDDEYRICGCSDSEIAVVVYGRMFFEACKAAQILSEKNIYVKIVKINKIIPLNEGLFHELMSTERIFFFEEGMKNGGVGEALGLHMLENGYKGKYFHRAVKGEFIAHASVHRQLDKYGLSAEKIARSIENEVTQ